MKKKFSLKVFTSFNLFLIFVVITITGIVLYFTPPGRVANWINWTFLGLTKTQWQAIHTIFSFAFIAFSIIHLFFVNWKSFFAYIKKKSENSFNRTKELYLSLIISLIFFFGTLYNLPPFVTIMDFGEYLTESWETEEEAPPIPHTEKLSINELANQLENFSKETILRKLESNQIKFKNENQTLSEIGLLNNKSPEELYKLITTKNKSGSGLGRKTLKELAELNKINLKELLQNLKNNKIEATPESLLKEIAEKNNITPFEFYNRFFEQQSKK